MFHPIPRHDRLTALFALVVLLYASHPLARGGLEQPIKPTAATLVGKNVQGMLLTQKDTRFLEPVCQVVIANEGQWWDRMNHYGWLDRPEYAMARGVRSFHHYCWAQIAHGRIYSAVSPQERKDYAMRAVGDYQFTLSHKEYLPQDWPYLPKVLVALGSALQAAGAASESNSAYLQALERDKGYVQAYIGLADNFSEAGKKDKALELVTQGLRHAPGSKPLQRRYQSLGGKLPYPAPLQATPTTAASAPGSGQGTATPGQGAAAPSSPSSSAAVATAPATPALSTPGPAGGSAKPTEPAVIAPPSHKTAPAESKKGGANPYCRFCP
jgi:hypothetical protein